MSLRSGLAEEIFNAHGNEIALQEKPERKSVRVNHPAKCFIQFYGGAAESRIEEEHMNTRGAIQLLIACAFALAMIAPAARASERDQATQLTFTQSVQIPGDVVLPAGTYWFKLADSNADRNIVQVFDSNWSIIATTIAIPTQRPAIKDHTMLSMAEGSPDQPDILVKWFYPGEATGHEFLYPAPVERQLSEENVITVMALRAPRGTQIARASY